MNDPCSKCLANTWHLSSKDFTKLQEAGYTIDAVREQERVQIRQYACRIAVICNPKCLHIIKTKTTADYMPPITNIYLYFGTVLMPTEKPDNMPNDYNCPWMPFVSGIRD